MNTINELDTIRLSRDYDAVEQLWNLLVRLSIGRTEGSEFDRIKACLTTLQPEAIKHWLDCAGIDSLIQIKPPLESILSSRHERLELEKAKNELTELQESRVLNPILAGNALLKLLKRIRNKRVHGFKTPDGPRDSEILTAARQVLENLCEALCHEPQKTEPSAPPNPRSPSARRFGGR